MTRVYLGLTSRAGERLGHLVRGVQMLRSYGSEAEVINYSDVVDAAAHADAPPTLCCLLECSSTATKAELRDLCRETEWAVGDDDQLLSATIVRYGDHEGDQVPAPLVALHSGKLADGMTAVLTPGAFAKLCDWGQQVIGADPDVIGEWPSATGP